MTSTDLYQVTMALSYLREDMRAPARGSAQAAESASTASDLGALARRARRGERAPPGG
ncbi:hypothetical protein OHB11_35460 [Streptomyces zaomyceticus]|uniref:Uncharacterized protein n=1 Tax=Streptomyces zaomyceticus TaxID=68286 RepID=A0ABZ1LL21_9ACTN|nr:hypothetical protein OG237_04405 [Streptomyces zaomyceticus]